MEFINLRSKNTCTYSVTFMDSESAVLRVSNIYGENQDCAKPLGAVAHFTSRIFEDKPIEVWGDGSVVRDYVHVDDVARALITAATYSGSHHIFNIGSGRGTSLNDLLKLLKKHTLLPVNVVYRPGELSLTTRDTTPNNNNITGSDIRIRKISRHRFTTL